MVNTLAEGLGWWKVMGKAAVGTPNKAPFYCAPHFGEINEGTGVAIIRKQLYVCKGEQRCLETTTVGEATYWRHEAILKVNEGAIALWVTSAVRCVLPATANEPISASWPVDSIEDAVCCGYSSRQLHGALPRL